MKHAPGMESRLALLLQNKMKTAPKRASRTLSREGRPRMPILVAFDLVTYRNCLVVNCQNRILRLAPEAFVRVFLR